VRASEPTIRGRWLVGEQIRRRTGIPLPAELSYDDFTIDVPENQLVRAALRRLLAMPALPPEVRVRLRRSDRVLSAVEPTRRGTPAPSITFDRRNEHYRPLIALAQLIHANESIEHRTGDVLASGFLLDLPRVFEDYLAVAVADAAQPYGGRILSQDARPFDLDGRATIRPDLIWTHEGRVRAVFDAKYKAEKPEGYPNADLYQALAYAVRLRLPAAHLVYAAGGALAARYQIVELGKVVVAHALDLAKPPGLIDADVQAIVAQAATA
jgi:5-methylcytosine-specific restriction enzyme subunit McrC